MKRPTILARLLMPMEMGFQGTPGILFRDGQGLVQRRAGMPTSEDLPVVHGEP